MKVNIKAKLRMISITLLMLIWVLGVSATLIVNEGISTWTAHGSYGTYTQAIPAGTVSMTRCLVSPGAAANGLGSTGRVQMEALTGALELPQFNSVGDVEFNMSAGSAGRTVRLQKWTGTNWLNITTFNNIGATGSRFFYHVGINSSVKIRLFYPSQAIYVHDIYVTDYQDNSLPITTTPSISNITYSTASAASIIAYSGSSEITNRGFCWSVEAAPDTSDAHVNLGMGISPMSGQITDLQPNTQYYLRAYAANSSGVAYSSEATFSTIGIVTPTGQTTDFVFYPGSTSIQASWTPGNGSRRLVKISNTPTISEPVNGIEYSPNPIYGGSGEQVVYCGATQVVEGENINGVSITGLQRNTAYYFRAFEMNGSGETAVYLTVTATNNPSNATTLNTGIEGYYNNATGWGFTLKSNLHQILEETHLTQFSYSAVWDQLQYTDEDSLNTNNVIETYTGWSVPKNYYGTGSTQWNREHTWSVSHGGFGTNRPAGTDLHHLRPCDVTVNSAKNNRDFDNGGTAYVDSSPYGSYNATTGCNTSNDTWEPRPVEKGDVARMLFYMAVRYEGTDTGYDLEMQDVSATTGAFYGKLSTLLQWHYDDPPDSWERRRNERIQERQGNRNPFIDHPEFVGRLWEPLALEGICTTPYLVTVRWSQSMNAQGYRIDVSTDSNFTNLLVEDFAVDATQNSHQFEFPGVEAIYYRVRAFLGSGYSRYSNLAYMYIGSMPFVLSTFSATPTMQNTVSVNWSTNSEMNLLGFQVYRNTSSDINSALLISGIIQATNTSTQADYSFMDAELPAGEENLYYWLDVIAMDGQEYYFGPQYAHILPSAVQDDSQSPAPISYKLYPNPFTDGVNVDISLKQNTPLTLTVYNLKGQRIKSHLTHFEAGKGTWYWDGKDNAGMPLSAGLYFLRISTPDSVKTVKLLKLR